MEADSGPVRQRLAAVATAGPDVGSRSRSFANLPAVLLAVGYFHVVFTLPAEIAAITFHSKVALYDLLFRAASETMLTIAADPKHLGARIGITAVLHLGLGADLSPACAYDRSQFLSELLRRATHQRAL